MRRLFLKLFRRRRLERDLAEEMAFHRDMAAAGGNTLPFGNRAVIAEQARDLWRFSSVENLWRDVIYGIRGLVRQPALLASAVLSLALGIGANATIFSLGMELLLSEPSVTDAASLVYVRDRGNSHSEPDKLDALRESGLFADVAGHGGDAEGMLNWNDGQETRPIFGSVVTKNYFSTLGVPVARGRGIQPSDPDDGRRARAPLLGASPRWRSGDRRADHDSRRPAVHDRGRPSRFEPRPHRFRVDAGGATSRQSETTASSRCTAGSSPACRPTRPVRPHASLASVSMDPRRRTRSSSPR